MSDLTERTPLICEAITEAFGPRCDDFEPDCWCCKVWAEFDDIAGALAEARDKALEEAANVAEIDDRSPLAKQSGHEPSWFSYAKAIAAAIRDLKASP